jgi:hypothetical protein
VPQNDCNPCFRVASATINVAASGVVPTEYAFARSEVPSISMPMEEASACI